MLRFRVPASTTNLGHGFDCLGIALGFANTISIAPHASSEVTAPSAADPGLAPLAARLRDACAKAWGIALPGFAITLAGDVPIARGMGSSATILIGAAAALAQLAGRNRDPAALIAPAADTEGHPDNVAAAALGGVVAVAPVADSRGTHGASHLRTARFPVPDGLVAVVAIPPFEVKTAEARRILPATLDRAAAVRGWGRTALILAAMAQHDLDALRGLFDDAWHEAHRAALNPGLIEARQAAQAAGALGTILSGSGSTVLSFVRSAEAEAVRSAVAASYAARGVAARVLITAFDNAGVCPA